MLISDEQYRDYQFAKQIDAWQTMSPAKIVKDIKMDACEIKKEMMAFWDLRMLGKREREF